MRLLALFLISMNFMFANAYYAKLEPITSFQVKAAVSGKVVFTNDNLEGKKAKSDVVIELDSFVNKVDLKQTKNKLESINKMIRIEQNNFERLSKVSSKSDFEKDNQKIKVINLQTSKADTLIKIATLEDTIKNKKLFEKDNYIFNIAVKKGDYVNPGTLLYEAKDLKKGKLEIFIPISDIEMVKKSTIFLDDKKTSLKLAKVFLVADTEHISSYKVEIHLLNVEKFSRLIKIEFK